MTINNIKQINQLLGIKIIFLKGNNNFNRHIYWMGWHNIDNIVGTRYVKLKTLYYNIMLLETADE